MKEQKDEIMNASTESEAVRLAPRGAQWRQCGDDSVLRTPWQTFTYLKSSILRFNRHTSSFLPSHHKSLTEDEGF
jgi:hypothetical protein